MVVGVLALQGGVDEHLNLLADLGVESRRVRLLRDLDGLDGLILPGGESTVMDKLARSFGLAAPLQAWSGPVFATCAGLIYAASDLENPAPGQQTLGLLDITVRRNAFGSQRDSFDTNLAVEGYSVAASFIRAPEVTRVGDGVEGIAAVGERIVGVRQGTRWAVSFHPEEHGDTRLHQAWLDSWAEPRR